MGTDHPTAPRSGRGLTVSFGLVNVGVKYAPLVDAKKGRLSGKYIDPETHGPVTQQYVNEKGEVVKPVSGYEYGGDFVVLEDRQALESERDKRLELRAFIEQDTIDPLYFEKTYLVWPEKGQEAGYDLLCTVLADTGKVLLGTTVLSKSTKAVMLRYGQGCLLAHVCAYDANVDWYDHKLVTQALGERPAPPAELVETAMTLLSGLPDEFDLSEMQDEYDLRLRQAIEAQASGRKLVRTEEEPVKPTADLMAALIASVEAVKKQPQAKSNGKAKAKRTKKAVA